jgi:hypothetical protein
VWSKNGQAARVLLLSQEQARNTWKLSLAGHDYIVISEADVFAGQERLYLRARDVDRLLFFVFPDFKSEPATNLQRSHYGGTFTLYDTKVKRPFVLLRWEKSRPASSSLPVKKGQYNAIAPTDTDFERAGVWRVTLPKNAMNGISDLFLQIDYIGDVGRLYAGSRLLTDDFYKGTVWEIGLKRFAPEVLSQSLQVKVMPLRKDAPIYIPRGAWRAFPARGEVAEVRAVKAIPEYEVTVQFGKGTAKSCRGRRARPFCLAGF